MGDGVVLGTPHQRGWVLAHILIDNWVAIDGAVQLHGGAPLAERDICSALNIAYAWLLEQTPQYVSVKAEADKVVYAVLDEFGLAEDNATIQSMSSVDGSGRVGIDPSRIAGSLADMDALFALEIDVTDTPSQDEIDASLWNVPVTLDPVPNATLE